MIKKKKKGNEQNILNNLHKNLETLLDLVQEQNCELKQQKEPEPEPGKTCCIQNREPKHIKTLKVS